MDSLVLVMELLAAAGLAQALLGVVALRRFRARTPAPMLGVPPKVTVLKPLCRDEPLLEEALATICEQDYPDYQIVFGVQDAVDPALDVVRRLRERFPGREISTVTDPTRHGANRKIANLMNMLPLARHNVLVIADSDVHAPPDYLHRLVAELARPGTGLATTLYTGIPGRGGVTAAIGATGLTHGFMPGVLMGTWFGRQDCLGATMALRRETLMAAGGLQALADHIADDHILGKNVRGLGLQVRLADTICATTVPESSARALFSHELRWARTVLALVPVQFALSAVQFPLFWAALAVGLSGGATVAAAAFVAVWAGRAMIAAGVDATLRRPGAAASPRFAAVPIWLLPLRDIMSVTVMLASTVSTRVEWRGQTMHTAPLPPQEAPDYTPRTTAPAR